MTTIFLARLIDPEETWKCTNGGGRCKSKNNSTKTKLRIFNTNLL